MRTVVACVVGLTVLICTGSLLAQTPPAAEEGRGGEVGPVTDDPESVYSHGIFKEVYIDQDYKLYETRKYQGVVPGLKQKEGGGEESPARKNRKIEVTSLGMEQLELFTRIFLVVDSASTPWVYDNFAETDANPGAPYQIIMELAGAVVPRRTDRLPIITSAFNTPVAKFQAVPAERGVKLIITLKRKARYLPGQDDSVLFVDVER